MWSAEAIVNAFWEKRYGSCRLRAFRLRMSAPGDTSIDADRTFTLEELQGNEKVHLNGVASAINPTGTVTGEDYSTRLQEFLTLDHEDEHEPIQHTSHDSGHLDFDVDEEDDEDEEFVYTGVDAPPEPVGYDAQLADILEGDDVQVDGSDVFINSGQDEPLEFGKYKVCARQAPQHNSS